MTIETKNQELLEILLACLKTRRENEFFDMKLKWHDKTEDLIKDIICFSNTVHDRNSFIFFGISDDFEIIGLNVTKRTKQADIVDAMSKLHFSGSERPSFEINTVSVKGKEIDVLVIFNNDKTPIFLEKSYGKMKAGCIYTRERDRNTPDGGNATFAQIEALWKKRFGLIKPTKEYFFDLLENKNNWEEIYPEYYNVFQPEYRLKVTREDNNGDEFYSYVMTSETTSYYQIDLMYNLNKLDSFQGVSLDSGRLFIPTARSGFIHNKEISPYPICSYKYYVKNSEEFKLLQFFYDSNIPEQKSAFEKILSIFLIFQSDEEHKNFKNYVGNNIEHLYKTFESKTQYDYLEVPKESPDHLKFKKYIKELRCALSLNQMLESWRKT